MKIDLSDWRFLRLFFQEKEKGPNIKDALLHEELKGDFLQKIDIVIGR